MNSQSKASAICSDTISSQHGRYTDTTIRSLRSCGREESDLAEAFCTTCNNCLPSNTKYDTIRNREKNSVLSMFGHTKEASVLRHWSLFVLFGKNTPQSSCVSS